MKNKLEHIDKIFLEATADDAVKFSTKKGWRMVKIRLLLIEILTLNFANVNWSYLIYAGILLFLFSFSFVYFKGNENTPQLMSKTISTEIVIPNDKRNDSLTQYKPSEPSQKEVHKVAEIQAPQLTTPVKTSLSAQNAKSNTDEKQQEEFNKTKQSSISIVSNLHGIYKLHPKKYSGQISLAGEPFTTTSQTFQPIDISNPNEVTIAEKQEKKSAQFLVGFIAGSVFMLNEAGSAEEIQKPVLYAGLKLRYSRTHLYFETAVEFSYYESVVNSTYRYDSVLGTIASSGYDIVEVINEDGKIVLERQYYSELVTIYDTLSSNDKVTISSNSAVLCIPLSIGSRIFQRGNFYTNVFAGAVFKILLVKNQSLPEFGAENRRIIAYETNPVISYEPEFYFQGGLLFGYDISKSFSLEIQSSYNHILGGSSSIPQSSKSNIRAGIGLNFKF